MIKYIKSIHNTFFTVTLSSLGVYLRMVDSCTDSLWYEI